MKTVKLIRLYYPFYLSEVQIRFWESIRFPFATRSTTLFNYRSVWLQYILSPLQNYKIISKKSIFRCF